MATEVEESANNAVEKPGPPAAKKQKILDGPTMVGRQNDEAKELLQSPTNTDNPKQVMEEEENRRSRERLKNWQTCQVIRGFMDNTINSALESYRLSQSGTFEDPWYCLLRGNRIEDTAVSAAIRNYGLIRSLDLNQLPSLVNESLPNVPISSETAKNSVAAMSSETLLLKNSNSASTNDTADTWLDTSCDSDHHQDFLDRAIAEAIKKKGLSMLSVDYG